MADHVTSPSNPYESVKDSPLFILPREIRDKIYEFGMTNGAHRSAASGDEHSKQLSLLRICQAINSEAMPVLFKTKTCKVVVGAEDIPEVLPPSQQALKEIQHVECYVYIGELDGSHLIHYPDFFDSTIHRRECLVYLCPTPDVGSGKLWTFPCWPTLAHALQSLGGYDKVGIYGHAFQSGILPVSANGYVDPGTVSPLEFLGRELAPHLGPFAWGDPRRGWLMFYPRTVSPHPRLPDQGVCNSFHSSSGSGSSGSSSSSGQAEETMTLSN